MKIRMKHQKKYRMGRKFLSSGINYIQFSEYMFILMFLLSKKEHRFTTEPAFALHEFKSEIDTQSTRLNELAQIFKAVSISAMALFASRNIMSSLEKCPYNHRKTKF